MMPEHLTNIACPTDTAAKRHARVRKGNVKPRKLKVTLLILLMLALGVPTFAGTLPLNTGYDYSNWNTYPAGVNDDYWIRIASYPPVMPTPVGPSWAVAYNGNFSAWSPPMAGLTGIPSIWINAFGSTNASPSGASAQNPAYAIYRKTICLPYGYGKVAIRGSVRSDEAIQIWVNSVLNTVLPPSPININGTPYPINYTNQAPFHPGINHLFVLVEDTGVHTGFDLAANLTTSNGTPTVAKGPQMTFEPCPCNQIIKDVSSQAAGSAALSRAEADDRQVIKAIIQYAEERRLGRTRPRQR